ncbi:MAG: peroxiredoxin [Cytophagales bacterium]|nr:peroxiredoxin [Bernardetiaceae bacterium]MDW8210602.1 peroxiredoxin [Cytophagales bacterium]
MALMVGSQAPDFILPAVSGGNFQLYQQMAGKSCILYFYPKDFTTICTAEACSFRDHFEIFRNLNVAVIGISRDSLSTHQRFKAQYQLPFELLSDTEGKVAALYRAVVPIINLPKRITYLLDTTHKIIAVHEGLFDSAQHVRSMVKALQQK